MPRKLSSIYRKRRKSSFALNKKRPVESEFFELPPELRNYIYVLALAHPAENVYMSWTPGRSRKIRKPEITLGDSEVPLNCLKYVNRQLRQETKGLEIMVNPIIFVESRTQAAIKRVSLEEEPAAKEKTMFLWLRNNIKQVVDLFTFCACNPQTTVNLRVPWLEIIDHKVSNEYKAYLFVGIGIILTLMFRREDINFIAPHFGDDTSAACHRLSRKMLKGHRDTNLTLRSRATNLRFFPREVDWDPDEFRSCKINYNGMLFGSAVNRGSLSYAQQQDLEARLKHIKDNATAAGITIVMPKPKLRQPVDRGMANLQDIDEGKRIEVCPAELRSDAPHLCDNLYCKNRKLHRCHLNQRLEKPLPRRNM
ncbi:hypothetical protein BKA63DRAFT_572290 [Paraphoma chrysanthemicola]|nr:hypothetical protein BKA63DRAFT_572290 [Paraphoma chrysanthemicola]